MSELECVVIPPKKTARFSIIWLHGLGADGHDFEPVIPQLHLERLGVRFIFPHAPKRPVTVNNGMVMRAWYDAYGRDMPGRVDNEGMRASEAAIGRLIQKEIALGIPYSRIVLAGFSQGGAIALRAGLDSPEPLAGLAVLSSPLADPEEIMRKLAGPNRTTPILVTHGSQEAQIPEQVKAGILNQLTLMGCNIDWREYPRGHSICSEEIADIRTWLLRVWN